MASLEKKDNNVLFERGELSDNRLLQRDNEETMSHSTQRLRNSHRILQETVETNSSILGSLATSSHIIRQNEEQLIDQTGSVSSARYNLKKYMRRASTDKIILLLAFIFFCCCALVVAYRRLL